MTFRRSICAAFFFFFNMEKVHNFFQVLKGICDPPTHPPQNIKEMLYVLLDLLKTKKGKLNYLI